jgi:hypothetical protein
MDFSKIETELWERAQVNAIAFIFSPVGLCCSPNSEASQQTSPRGLRFEPTRPIFHKEKNLDCCGMTGFSVHPVPARREPHRGSQIRASSCGLRRPAGNRCSASDQSCKLDRQEMVIEKGDRRHLHRANPLRR